MSEAAELDLVTVEAYLEGELTSPVKHEYLAGKVYAMAGASNRHNLVVTNTSGALWGRLRGGRSQTFNSDTKVRIQLPTHVRFYYPDVQVVCRPNPPEDSYQDEPAILVEVLSPATRRVDEGEKKDAYLTIPQLKVYLLAEPDSPAITGWRRGAQGFRLEVYQGLEAVVPLPEVGTELPLAEIYQGVRFGTQETEQL